MAEPSPKEALEAFIVKYDPAIAKVGREALAAMRKLLPGAFELVYDNYNALGIGFAAAERGSVVFSIVLYPRWVSLFFFDGVALKDPSKRLKGKGSRIRHIVLDNGAATLAEPVVLSLIQEGIAEADPPLPQAGKGKMVIKSVSANQRPRRPVSLARRSRVGPDRVSWL
jgi:hypothetical protein